MKFVDNKEFLPDSYTAFKNKIGLTAEKRYIAKSKEVVLSWPYKDCILEGGQEKEDEKRKEIFHNEILAPDEIDRLLEPKVFTNFKKIDAKGEHQVKEIKPDDNLIIKGNNLLVLHSLKKKYAGKVKLIYIDPPYNTGNDEFKYNDNFNHSTWLTFMKNRLEVAKELLRDDGVIFIQINDIMQGYLKVLCDEVFGIENFHTTICVKMSHLSGVKMAHKNIKLPKIKEFILFYTKKGKIKLNPQYIPSSWEDALERYTSFIKKDGYSDDECEKWRIITVNQAMKEAGIDTKNKKDVLKFKLSNAHLIFRTARNRSADYSKYPKNKFSKIDNPDGSYYFIYKGEDVNFAAEKVMKINNTITPVVALGDIWTDIGINNLSNEGGVDLRFGKKPEKLIERILNLCTSQGDLVLDYHLGSGTTCAVAHKMGRQYIGVEQLDYGKNDSVQRLKNVIGKENSKGKLSATIEDYDTTGISKEVNWKGGGSFIYCELKEFNEEFVQKIEKAKDSKEILKVWEEMKNHAFLSYRVDPKLFDENIDELKKLPLEQQKDLLIKCLDVNNLYVNYSEIEDKQHKISKEDIELNKRFYGGL